MSVFVLNITTMVGLGVGIDYSLLIVTRFREELNRGLSPVDAAVRTIETAGSAVITSGLTVVVGFAALVTTPLSDTRSVGVGGLLVVAVAVLLATTFLPALLAVLGRNIDRPKWLARPLARFQDRKSTRLNSSHLVISYAVFCLKKKKTWTQLTALLRGIFTY